MCYNNYCLYIYNKFSYNFLQKCNQTPAGEERNIRITAAYII